MTKQNDMVIYEVIGYTAAIDYGSRSKKLSMGFFISEKRAQSEVDSIKSRDHWWMDYEDLFEIVEISVKA
jgi:hypothetical protein